jgi:hypothetical protein
MNNTLMKLQYRITNWPKYNRSLINRGNIYLYFSSEALSNWHNGGGGQEGRPREYSNSAIEIFLTLRTLLHLPLRQTQGFIEGLIKKMGLAITCPNYTLACRRAKELMQKLKKFPQSNESIHVLVDSSGLKIFGEGEWKMRTHGKSKRRTWRKIHIAINSNKKTIVACEITEANVGDCSAVKGLLSSIPEIESFTGDGGYDSNGVYNMVTERGAKAIIPPDENAVVAKHNHSERNEAVAFIKANGDDEAARKVNRLPTPHGVPWLKRVL